MTAPARFKQDDVTRAVRGCEKAGLRIGAVRIAPNGEIVILSEAVAPAAPRNPLDRLFDAPET